MDAQFEFVGRQTTAWLLTAEELKRAADILSAAREADLSAAPQSHSAVNVRPHPSLGGPYMLLVGFAVENLLKRVLIGRDPNQFPRTHAGIQTRDLKELAHKADIGLNAYEDLQLQRLTQFATWTGRYPTSVRAEGMNAWRAPDVKIRRPRSGYGMPVWTDRGNPVSSTRLTLTKSIESISDSVESSKMKTKRRDGLLLKTGQSAVDTMARTVVFARDKQVLPNTS